MQRTDGGYTEQRKLDLELPGRKKRGKTQKRFTDVMKEDMARVGVAGEDATYADAPLW